MTMSNSTHMSGQPTGGPNQGPPGTSMKATSQQPTSPSALTDGGNHPALPTGNSGAHGAKDSIGGNTGK
jgi:hypothetical protein